MSLIPAGGYSGHGTNYPLMAVSAMDRNGGGSRTVRWMQSGAWVGGVVGSVLGGKLAEIGVSPLTIFVLANEGNPRSLVATASGVGELAGTTVAGTAGALIGATAAAAVNLTGYLGCQLGRLAFTAFEYATGPKRS